MKILTLIPARSGSKSVPDKNIRDIGGKPMLAWSIEHGIEAGRLLAATGQPVAKSLPDRKGTPVIEGQLLQNGLQDKGSEKVVSTRIIVSTDSEEYARIAREYGAETPFIRPAEYATDTALDIDVFRHALMWLDEHESYRPDITVQLRPTYPKRDPRDIAAMVQMLIEHPEADSVRSVAPATEIPYKMWVCGEISNISNTTGSGEDGDETDCGYSTTATVADGSVRSADRSVGAGASGICLGRIEPVVKEIPECYNMPRQQLPTAYYQNACIDIMRYDTVMRKNSMTGDVILGYLMKENLDIDTEAELEKAREAMEEEKKELIYQSNTYVFS